MTIVAWDIETCPQPIESLTEAQRARYDMELDYKLGRNPDMDEADASRLVRSVHPFLGWVCCISAVSGTLDGGPNDPVSWTAASMDDETALLQAFWQAADRFPKGTLWATFNGKRFDVPYVEARSAARGITPTRQDLRNTYPYGHKPHTDLAWLWPQHYALEGLCGLLDVPSPKSDVDGSGVADLVEGGRMDEVAAYCERDVVATFLCAQLTLRTVLRSYS